MDVLPSARLLVGVKQCKRALKTAAVERAYIAADAEEAVVGPIRALCAEQSVPVSPVETMTELGTACGIQVGAACAVVLREN